MGALVPLLFTVSRQARLQAAQAAVAENEKIKDDVKAEKEMVEWRIEQMQTSRKKTEAEIETARLELGHLEDHSRRLRSKIAELEKTISEIDRSGTDDGQKRAATSADLEELRKQITEAERQLAEAKNRAAGKTRSFAIIPYEGPNSTHRRPIYVECRANCVVLQPEGIVLDVHDFEGPMGPNNPLASALRAEREYLLSQNGFDPKRDGEPYPLLLVRPDGIIAYYAARTAMKSWGPEFGYEFVDDEWKLAYQPPDPQMAQVVNKAVESARIVQERLIAAAPRQYSRSSTNAVSRGSGYGGSGGNGGGYGGGGSGTGNSAGSSGSSYGSAAGSSGGRDGEGFGGAGEDDDSDSWGENRNRRMPGEPDPFLVGVNNPYLALGCGGTRAGGTGTGGTGIGGNGIGGNGVGGTGVGGTGLHGTGLASGASTGTGNGGIGPALGNADGSGISGSGIGGPGGTSRGGNGIGGNATGGGGGVAGNSTGIAGGGYPQGGSPGFGPGTGQGGAGLPGMGGSPGNLSGGTPGVGGLAGGPAGTQVGNGIGPQGNISGGTPAVGGVAGGPAGSQVGNGNGLPAQGALAGNGTATTGQGTVVGTGNGATGQGTKSSGTSAAAQTTSTGQTDPQGQGGTPGQAKRSNEPPDIFASRVAAANAAKSGVENRTNTSQSSEWGGPPAPPLHPGEYREKPPELPPHPVVEVKGPKKGNPAKYRAQDWGLRDTPHGSVPITRPVLFECQADRLLMLPDRGRGGNALVVMSSATDSSIDDVVSAIWQRMNGWGMAGKGMYWRPVLHVRVAPGGESRFSDLQVLLQGSGLDIVKQ